MLQNNQVELKEKYHKALNNLYKDIEAVKRDDKNPHFKSTFLSLPEMLKQLKPIFEKHDFVLVQPTNAANAASGIRNMVVSRIIHTPTGFSEESSLVLPDINDMQKIGASITYARRFTLAALTALEELDDDGETAVGRGTPRKIAQLSSKDKF